MNYFSPSVGDLFSAVSLSPSRYGSRSVFPLSHAMLGPRSAHSIIHSYSPFDLASSFVDPFGAFGFSSPRSLFEPMSRMPSLFSPSMMLIPRTPSFLDIHNMGDADAIASAFKEFGVESDGKGYSMSFSSFKDGNGPARTKLVINGEEVLNTDPALSDASSQASFDKSVSRAVRMSGEDVAAKQGLAKLAELRRALPSDMQDAISNGSELGPESTEFKIGDIFSTAVTREANKVSDKLKPLLSDDGKKSLGTLTSGLQDDGSLSWPRALNEYRLEHGPIKDADGKCLTNDDLGTVAPTLVSMLKAKALADFMPHAMKSAKTNEDGLSAEASKIAADMLRSIEEGVSSLFAGEGLPSWANRKQPGADAEEKATETNTIDSSPTDATKTGLLTEVPSNQIGVEGLAITAH